MQMARQRPGGGIELRFNGALTLAWALYSDQGVVAVVVVLG